ncbi:MAG TPA: molybdenum cofactor biosynthesis protein MoaE [Solirubrobacteraceae bacterium]|jgi:molybdopterin synthase catalytic subunit|nr:molybdenum cofactor biosynthesis protein MoaE [Solirubrobacteraceae bacterium]
MLVRIRLFAQLRERAQTGELELELPDGALVRDALERVSDLAQGLPLVMAVNRVYAEPDQVLGPGDELALIPPVSGGAPAARPARVTGEPLSVDRLIGSVGDPRAGAVVTFLGVTREVEFLDYEAYVEMAEERIGAILEHAAARHGLCAAAAEHRVGRVALGEPSVAVAVSAPHREQAFAGARAIIDEIKASAPIWKQEVEGDRAQWVPGQQPGP